MLRAASIGLGWWSNELARAIHGNSEKIGIVSCYSRSPERRRAFAETFKTGSHETMEALLADPTVDAVILTTPHSLHAEHVIAAARSGKHVFVEKPFTLTAQTGVQAARACSDAGVVLAVGHNRRFAAASQAISQMAISGEFGDILHIETNFSAPSAMNWTEAHWRASRKESPAGGLAGLGVHMIDLFTFIGGPVTRVLANARRRVLSVDVEDTTSALFDLGSGATAYLGTMCAAPYTVLCNVYGTKANAFAHVDADELRVQRTGGKMVEHPLQPVDTVKTELEEFADACAGKCTYRVTPDEAIHVVAVMEAIAASAAGSGKAVKLEP